MRHADVTITPTNDALVGAYRARLYPLFQPITVEGLPATQEQSSADSISCHLTVGTAPGQGFLLSYDGSPRQTDPCTPAREIAGRIVAQLPPLTK